MKKLYFLPFLFLAVTTFAQKQFVVQNGTTQTFDDLNEAIAAASVGDTLYLPGGGFNISPTTIDKTLHWRGVGHYPDSTAATGHTQITNAVNFTGNCDNSTFEGIYFQTTVTFGTNDDECTGVKMKRCRVSGTLYMRSTTDVSEGNPDLSFHLSECVTQGLDARYGKNIKVEKNMIFSTLNNFYQSFFNHNAVNDYDNNNRVIEYCENCQFTNNVFSYSYGLYNTYNCNFENNLFQSSLPYDPTTSTITGSENITDVGWQNIYNDISQSANIYTFSYDNNYHLKDGSPGIGAGTDGTNIGIYGTSLPYKDGAVPYHPHIQTADIDNEAVGGNLGVQINVAAQER